MITHYRKRAFKRIGLSAVCIGSAILLQVLGTFGLPEVVTTLGTVLLGTAAFVLYVQGNIALAEAKGYDSSVVAAIIVAASVCLIGLFFAMPLILMFGLKDKTQGRMRSLRREPKTEHRNPSPTLPPLKKDL